MDNRIFFKFLLLVIILGFIGYLLTSSETYNCNQCSVTFSNSKSMSIKYYMSELFEESKLNNCPIYWDRVRGYVKK